MATTENIKEKDATSSQHIGSSGVGTTGTGSLSPIAGGKSRANAGQMERTGDTWASQLPEGAQNIVRKAQDIAGNVADKAQEVAGGAIESGGSLIRQYPWQSLLVGFSAGCLVGVLLRR
jgi:ElaB/YqjD/DUF883 family membrane-anchored ribosome-binding protein